MRYKKTLFSMTCCIIVCVAGVTTASSQDNEPSYWKEEGLQNNLEELLDRLDRKERGEPRDLHEQSERSADEKRQADQTMQDEGRREGASGKASETSSSSCEADMPNACSDAIEEGSALIKNFSHSTGMTGSVSETFCMYLVGIDVNSFCADQYREIGRDDCAHLLDMNSDEYRKAMPQLRAMIEEGSNEPMREACSWER